MLVAAPFPFQGVVWGKGEGKSLAWGDADAQTCLGTQPAALQESVISQKDGNTKT